MADKRLINYIQEQLSKGYDTTTLKSHLIRHGYQPDAVDAAIRQINSPEVKHVIHFSPTTLISIAGIFVGLIVVVFVFLNFSLSEPKQLLDLNIDTIESTVKAGESITIIIDISNIGSATRFDVNVKYELINLKTNDIFTLKEETIGIETRSSKQTNVLIPSDAEPGNYLLRAIALYGDQRAVATLSVKVEGTSEEAVEKPVVEEPTEEEVPEETEEFEPEETEQEETGTSALNTFETLEKVEEIAEQDRTGAEDLCKELKLQTSRDLCFNKLAEVLQDKTYCEDIDAERTKDICLSNVAKLTDNSLICEEISKESRKDSCYMNFVIDKKDYTVCDKVTNSYLKQSCKSLEQLSKLNITDVAFYESLINQTFFNLV